MIGTQQTPRTYVTLRREADLATLPFVELPLRAGDIVEHPLLEHRYRLLSIESTGGERTGVFHRVRTNGDVDRRCKPFEDAMVGYARS